MWQLADNSSKTVNSMLTLLDSDLEPEIKFRAIFLAVGYFQNFLFKAITTQTNEYWYTWLKEAFKALTSSDIMVKIWYRRQKLQLSVKLLFSYSMFRTTPPIALNTVLGVVSLPESEGQL